jgi:hypothetical protein
MTQVPLVVLKTRRLTLKFSIPPTPNVLGCDNVASNMSHVGDLTMGCALNLLGMRHEVPSGHDAYQASHIIIEEGSKDIERILGDGNASKKS